MKAYDTNQPTNSISYIDALKKMTPREIEVLELVERGYTNKEIALELSLSEDTIKAHRKNICKKLGLRGRNSLIKWLWNSKIGDYEVIFDIKDKN